MNISRQYLWQLKKRAEGLCGQCGKRPLVNKHYCYKCNERNKAYNKEYYNRNKEARREYQRNWVAEHREKMAEYHRKHK
jgi:hypothetical protein